MDTQTRLTFDAKIASVGIRQAKDRRGEGKFELSLSVDQPQPPDPISAPWEFRQANGWKPRPAAPKRTKDESDDDFQARKQQLDAEQNRYDSARAAFAGLENDYQQRMTVYRNRIRAYAELVGITSVFGSKRVNVVLTPTDQDLLPGFGTELVEELPAALLFGPEDQDSDADSDDG